MTQDDDAGYGYAAPPRTLLERASEGIAGGASMPPSDRGPVKGPSASDQRRSLIALAGLVVLLVAGAVIGHFVASLVAAAVIAAVIMLHELGHFTAAKLSGMKVTEFFLGFGPRLWSIRRGETEYGVKAIPLGGYVRIIGMNNLERVDPADEPRTYRQQSFPRRLAVAVAGSTVHFALALVAVWSLFAFADQVKPQSDVAAVSVITGGQTPAQRAGFTPGDKIETYDGHGAQGHWNQMRDYIEKHIGVPITFQVLRRGRLVQLVATPADAHTLIDQGTPISADHVGFLGIAPTTTNYSLLGSVPHAFSTFWHEGVLGTFRGIGAIFSPAGISNIGNQVTAKPGSTPASKAGNRPTSVIGIVGLSNQIHDWGTRLLLFFEANVFVGVLNLFPVLPFDGGHVVIAVYERIRSRRGRRYVADVNKMLPYAFAVVMLLGFVFVSSLYLDVAHPITLH